jgi:hypothetical protein
LAEKDKEFKMAIRWLMEVERLNATHSTNNWMGDGSLGGDLAKIASVALYEAQVDVVRARKALLDARKALETPRKQ